MIVSPFFPLPSHQLPRSLFLVGHYYPVQGMSYYQRLSSWGRPALVGRVVIAELESVEIEFFLLLVFVLLAVVRVFLFVLVFFSFVFVFGVGVVK